MGKVQLRCWVGSGSGISLVDFVDGETEARVIVRWTAVVEIVRIGSCSDASTGYKGQELVHHDGCTSINSLTGL